MSALFLAGAEIDWRGAARGERREIVDLPTYPFQRQRHWFDGEAAAGDVDSKHAGESSDVGPPSGVPAAADTVRIASCRVRRRRSSMIIVSAESCCCRPPPGWKWPSPRLPRYSGLGAHAIEDLVLREAMTFTDGARIVHTIVEPAVEWRVTISRFRASSNMARNGRSIMKGVCDPRRRRHLRAGRTILRDRGPFWRGRAGRRSL